MKYSEEQFSESLNFIKQHINSLKPKVALILGSGLGETPFNLENIKKIPYSEIPNFPVSTVKGHQGNLLLGNFRKTDCIIMQGRFHYYEGYSTEELFLPIRLLSKIGIRNLIVTNAAGGISPDFQPGDFMIILDHINLMGRNPLVGINPAWLKSRFVDMSHAYDPQLIKMAETVGIELKIPMKRGVYAAMSGPSPPGPSPASSTRSSSRSTPERSTSARPSRPAVQTGERNRSRPSARMTKTTEPG